MNLRNVRDKSNMQQAEVAKGVGITVQTYSAYETGVRKPTPEMVCNFADFFNVSADEILGRAEPQQLFDDARVPQPEIMRLYNIMNEYQQLELVSYARGMLARAASSTSVVQVQSTYNKNYGA